MREPDALAAHLSAIADRAPRPSTRRRFEVDMHEAPILTASAT